MIQRLRELVPVPMAAPETPELRRMRYWMLLLLVALASLLSTFAFWVSHVGICAVALVVGLSVALLIKVPVYFTIKERADKAWLEEQRSDD